MLLSPLYIIHLTDPGVLILSDHKNQHCGEIYKLAKDHTSQEVMRLGLLAQSEQEKFMSAHCDLRAFAQFVPNDPSTPVKDRDAKQAAFSFASMGVFDIDTHHTLNLGVEVDAETLKVRYWLVIHGFTQDIKVRLKKYRGRPT